MLAKSSLIPSTLKPEAKTLSCYKCKAAYTITSKVESCPICSKEFCLNCTDVCGKCEFAFCKVCLNMDYDFDRLICPNCN